MFLNASFPNMIENLITDNDGIGLFIRDKCSGEFKNNIVIN